MTNCDRLVKLDALLEELSLRLQVLELALRGHVRFQKVIVWLWKLDTWEQVICDTRIEWDIIGCELGQVDIFEGSETDLILRPIEGSPQVTTGGQDSFQSSHTEIIMILR